MTTDPTLLSALAPATRKLPAPAALHTDEAATWIWPGAPMVLPASAWQTIACDAGTLWLTQGDGEDYVLTAGQRLTLAPRDEVVITAMRVPAIVRCANTGRAKALPATRAVLA